MQLRHFYKYFFLFFFNTCQIFMININLWFSSWEKIFLNEHDMWWDLKYQSLVSRFWTDIDCFGHHLYWFIELWTHMLIAYLQISIQVGIVHVPMQCEKGNEQLEKGNPWSPKNTSWRTWVAIVFSRLLFFIWSNTIDSGVQSVNPINWMLLLSFLNCTFGCMDISSMMIPPWNPAGGIVFIFASIQPYLYSHQPLKWREFLYFRNKFYEGNIRKLLPLNSLYPLGLLQYNVKHSLIIALLKRLQFGFRSKAIFCSLEMFAFLTNTQEKLS